MNRCLFIFLIGVIFSTIAYAQEGRRGGSGGRGGGAFSLANLSSGAKKDIPDSLLKVDSAAIKSRRLTAYRVTPLLGEPYVAPLDTNRLNFGQSTLAEYQSLSSGYLGNVGSPIQTRLFFDRKEARDFIFADAYDYYLTPPEKAYFYDTKIPYTSATYTTANSDQNKEERFKVTMSINFGKKLNVGGDLDYIYSRGLYNSNSNKMFYYRIFGSLRLDRYEAYAYLSNANIVNYENGGITNDKYITNPDDFNEGPRITDSKSIPVRFTDTWNRVQDKQYFLTHRYNLGFERELEETDSLGVHKIQFIPVSSIIHTFEYEENKRRFLSKDAGIDTTYTHIYGLDSHLDDRMSYWQMKNTLGLSLREGFQDWVKFGLAVYIDFEKRRYQLQAPVPGLDYGPNGRGLDPTPSTLNYPIAQIYDEFSTYIGGELSKRQGKILTYNARGELCVVGSDVGEIRITGELQTKFPLFNKEASIKAIGYFKNLTPAFYQRHLHSRYFWYDMDLKNTQRIFAGAEINLESTRTKLSAGVESLQNFVYFGNSGLPEQYGSNLQVVSAKIKQDFKVRALGWENEVAWQMSSNKSVLPLPQISAYSNLYLAFKFAKVLTIQIGADVHYFTEYNAPYYEPATQQFQTQDKVKIGNWPLVNAYANFHLKQARFFVMGYNIGNMFIDPNYFSLAHYPLNPTMLKLGIAVTFNN